MKPKFRIIDGGKKGKDLRKYLILFKITCLSILLGICLGYLVIIL